MSSVDSLPRSDRSTPMIGRHPAGLYVLFGAEMWERFSYYGMRALLVLYLTNHLRLDRADALNIYAIYTGLVYLTPLLGGYLADRYLGQRKAILIGGSLMALGHFAMAFEPLLNLALGLLILGNGFFKPNISTMVGQLYPQHDARRDSAYTIFYMGINLGAFFSPLVCGTLGEKVGWHYGFAAAGVGMVIGLINFSIFQKALGPGGFAPDGPRRLTAVDWVHVVLLTAIGAGLVMTALWPKSMVLENIPTLSQPILLVYWIVLAMVLVGITKLLIRTIGAGSSPDDGSPIDAAMTGDVAEMVEPGRGEEQTLEAERSGHELPGSPSRDDPEHDEPMADPMLDIEDDEKEDPHAPFTSTQWQRIAVIVIVAVFSIVFWMGFEQSGGTLNLFADKRTDRVALDREFPASWYQSVNPLLIILFAPVLSVLWGRLDRSRFAVNSAAKMGLGLVILGLGMMVMAYADSHYTIDRKAGPLWLVAVYFLFTMGELCLSPIGLSLVNKLAPIRVASLMMALWFTCTAGANYLAGKMESIVGEEHLWTFLVLTSIIPGILLLLLNPLLKKMGHGRI